MENIKKEIADIITSKKGSKTGKFTACCQLAADHTAPAVAALKTFCAAELQKLKEAEAAAEAMRKNFPETLYFRRCCMEIAKKYNCRQACTVRGVNLEEAKKILDPELYKEFSSEIELQKIVTVETHAAIKAQQQQENILRLYGALAKKSLQNALLNYVVLSIGALESIFRNPNKAHTKIIIKVAQENNLPIHVINDTSFYFNPSAVIFGTLLTEELYYRSSANRTFYSVTAPQGPNEIKNIVQGFVAGLDKLKAAREEYIKQVKEFKGNAFFDNLLAAAECSAGGGSLYDISRPEPAAFWQFCSQEQKI